MSDTSAYFCWLPSLEAGGTVASVFLTRGRNHGAPEGGREFFEAVLSTLGIDAPLAAWGTHPFVTRYFTGGEWEEAWDARLLLGEKVRELSTAHTDGVPVRVQPASEVPPPMYLPIRVLADFGSRAAASRCRNELRKRAAKAKWNEVHYERYNIRDIAPHRQQLAIDVITVDRTRLQEFVPSAEEVITICMNQGGGVTARNRA